MCFKNAGNEDLGKRAGNVYINIFCKSHPEFTIINDYDIRYRLYIANKDVIVNDLETNNNIISDIKQNNSIDKNIVLIIKRNIIYLDLKKYLITIKNPIINNFRFYEYSILNYGLYKPNGERGSLIIEVLDGGHILRKGISRNHESEISFVEI